jgi:hypothetical protein
MFGSGRSRHEKRDASFLFLDSEATLLDMLDTTTGVMLYCSALLDWLAPLPDDVIAGGNAARLLLVRPSCLLVIAGAQVSR